ncbi:MAG TPA: ABC transporter transmembrane domain-containing protein [Alphaproteobacteria bacterium]|jgi:ATP-binding cassette subfamily B protein|nr:ABC transporter transmembrane domain-containing protein [Alphaproteobacteria bacterium]
MFNPRRQSREAEAGAIDPATGTATDERRRDLKPLLRLWPFLRPHGLRIAGAAVALVIGAVSTLVLGKILQRLLDRGFNQGNAAYLDEALLQMLIAIAFMALAAFLRMYLGTWLGERLVADLRKSLFRHLLGLDMTFYESAKTGAVVSRITADTTLLQSVVTTSAPIALRQFMTLIGGLALLFYTSPKLTALVLVVVPIVVGSIIVFGRRVRSLSRTTRDRVADIGAFVSEMLNAISTIQAFSRERTASREFAQSAERTFTASVDYARVRAGLTAFVMLVVFAAIGIILWIGGREVFAGKMSAGDLAAFIFYSTVVAGAVGSISEIMAELQRGSAAIDRIQALLDVKPNIAPPAAPVTLPAPKGAIQFDGIEFRYPTRPETSALTDFNLKVEPGETVALVGPSGAGKTTVFQLLLRFYDPQQGTIRIDGVDLTECDPQALRSRIALVAQDPVIFSTTAMENIRYGRPEATDAEVRTAALAANAAAFIEALSDGYGTFLGERGVRLSGGQRQRIAIARAILRNPAILLLDEATSALDAESERAVQDALVPLMRGRTTLVIAHRLATVQNAQRIVVMENGGIAAAGTHGELVRHGGLYARLAALQFDLPGEAAE